MADKGRKNMPASGWIPGDGSASNLPARLEYIQSTGAGTRPRNARYVFEDDEYQIIHFAFQLPEDYKAGEDVKFKFTWNSADATGDRNVYWIVFCAAITESDAEHIGTVDFTTGVAATDTADGTTLEHNVKEITVNEDGAAPDDWFMICLQRRGGNVSDTLTGDAYFLGGVLTWDIEA